ncbi:MAG TPA: cob(I)yrinic acid a,c-diamide adenosyltransferase [Nitrospiraceae bacterium]|nr:cob(I)yrinic acid a,c-diamide adenosyltransferase [Nitrospiraceae bacterium]
MRITKVYTRTGDAGKTRLAGGQQVWKDSLRVEAYGTVDELNSSIGVVRVFNVDQGSGASWRAGGGGMKSQGSYAHATRLEEDLRWVQNKLFDAGSILATAPGQTFKNMPQVTAKDVTRLERIIDTCQTDLAPLKEFILPGGGKISGLLHQARTVCRRAERMCVKLSHEESVDPAIVKFLNRLSDALFVWARWVAKTQGEPEFLWERDIKYSDDR